MGLQIHASNTTHDTANPNPTPQTNLTQELVNISERLKSTEEKLKEKMAAVNRMLKIQQENLSILNQSLASTAMKKTVADFREHVRTIENTCKMEAKSQAQAQAQANIIEMSANARQSEIEKLVNQSFDRNHRQKIGGFR